VVRNKRLQLGVSGRNSERKALGFFGHVTRQASEPHETGLYALQTARCAGQSATGYALRAFPNPSSKQRHIVHRVVLAVKRPQRAEVGAGSGSQQVVF
jgi:hypothetical protein